MYSIIFFFQLLVFVEFLAFSLYSINASSLSLWLWNTKNVKSTFFQSLICRQNLESQICSKEFCIKHPLLSHSQYKWGKTSKSNRRRSLIQDRSIVNTLLAPWSATHGLLNIGLQVMYSGMCYALIFGFNQFHPQILQPICHTLLTELPQRAGS